MQDRVKNCSNVNHSSVKATKAREKCKVAIQLPVSNPNVVFFSDFLNEVQRRFNVEKNMKLSLFAFIFERGLADEWYEWERTHNTNDPSALIRVIEDPNIDIFKNSKS